MISNIVNGRILAGIAVGVLLMLIPVAFAQVEVDEPGSPVSLSDSLKTVTGSQIDLNMASRDQLIGIGLTEAEADAILDHILMEGPYENFYELYDTEGLPQETVERIGPKVIVRMPGVDDPVTQRREANAYRIEQLVSDEGFSEGLADQLADQILDPIDVNSATEEELTDIQNVSPIDAAAIVKRIRSGNPIKSARELRQTPGLSHYGYINARPYVNYEPGIGFQQVHGFFQTRLFDTPYLPDNSASIRDDAPTNRLDLNAKLRLNYLKWKFGVATHRARNEDFLYDHTFGSFSTPQGKIFLEKDYTKLGPVTFKKLILGNFQAGFGQGLIFSSGDYFQPRQTGFGYSKSINGVLGDLSASNEFAYRGAAFEGRGGPFEFTGLYSSTWKDAVLNTDGTVNRFIVMQPRYVYDARPPMDTMYVVVDPNTSISDTIRTKVDRFPGIQSYLSNTRENIFAGNLQFIPAVGVRLGASWVEALYSRPIRAQLDTTTLVNGSDMQQMDDYFPDIEISEGYSNASTSKLWSGAKSRMRIYGFDWQFVYKNFSFQGEYGEQEHKGSFWRIGDDPHGFVSSLYAQYSSLNLLLLYRDRNVGYDNIYDRGYANYSRFKSSIFGDEFYLKDVVIGQLYDNSFQPQPERGWFLSGRYQVLRQLITSFELDQWTRTSDDAEHYRWVMRLQYRPIFPLSFNLRLSDQARDYQNSENPRYYRAMQGRLQTNVRLSNYDQVSFLYSYSVTQFAPRPRLFYDALPDGKSPVSGQGTSPAEAFGMSFRHNLNRSLWIGAGGTMYDGFFWNYEEGDFYIRDGKGIRFYGAIGSHLGSGVYVKAKATTEHPLTITNMVARKYNSSIASDGKIHVGDNVASDDLSFRIQLDYSF